jgi:hypothetical protein
MKRILTIAALLFAAAVPAVAQLDNKCVIESCVECNCYWSSECGSNQLCDYGSGCTHVGKKDGTCKDKGSGDGGQVAAVSAALDMWLQAYENPTPDKGLPNSAILDRIRALGLSRERSRAVRLAAFNAMDVVLGFDFGHPRGDCDLYDARCLGILRIPPDRRARQFLQTVRSAISQSIRTGNRATLQRSVNLFRRRNPTFKPHHTGRCYPHGHHEYPFRSVPNCVGDELSRIVDDLVPAYGKKQ